MADPTPAPAQITYTTNPLTSPIVLGAIVSIIASFASKAGIHILDDPAMQQQAILVLGAILTGLAHYIWPDKDGRLSISAPLLTPASQPVPAGASVVNVAAATDKAQATSVQPIDVGTHTVEVAPPAQVGVVTPASVTVTANP